MNDKLLNRTKKIRKSNIELLRILAMVMIVAHHLAVHSGFSGLSTGNRLWVRFISIGGKIGVDIFVLISGYFLVNAKSFKLKKLIKLWSQIITYSSIIYFVFVLSGLSPFFINELLKSLAPISFTRWWFASTYFILYLVSPFINQMLRNFDKRQYLSYICLILGLWCFLPTVTLQPYLINNLIWFIAVYSVGGYIRLC